jgi:hypothetical protein
VYVNWLLGLERYLKKRRESLGCGKEGISL